MLWPKYYQNQILVPCQTGFIGIICGWSKREKIQSSLAKENLEKVGAIGQLYSKEGVNYIIRNIYLNPQITTLIVTGINLSGSLDFFKNFLNSDFGEEVIHKQIPKENISKFKEWFLKNTFFVDENNLNDFIQKLNLPQQKFIENIIDFPLPKQESQIDLQSEEICFRLEDKKIADLWLKILDRVLKFGCLKMSQYAEMQKELINVTTVINGENIDDPYLPEFLYFNKTELENYYPQLMTDKIFDNVEYTYGSRLRNFQGINQIEQIIKDLKQDNCSRRAIAFTWDVLKDTGNPKSPCLNLVNALVQNNKVYLTAYMRSNDMFRAWPQNSFAFRKIQKEISDALNLEMGKLCIISNSAHIYERDFVDALEKIQKHKPKTECVHDPRGNFEITIVNNQINVNHYSSQGKFMQKFIGTTAEEIQNQIYPYVSDIIHAMYLGKELAKAEMALKKNSAYLQDHE